MRRRRKFRGTWFPVIGTPNDSETPTRWTTVNDFFLELPELPDIVVAVRPLILDVPQEPDDNTSSIGGNLGAFTQNAYALRRIVGKCNVWHETTYTDNSDAGSTPAQSSIIVAAGIFVARAADASDTGGGLGSPIGGANTWQSDYNPLEANCIREPWLWRRTWTLQNAILQQRIAVANLSGLYVPSTIGPPGVEASSNLAGRSVLDGPHVDARTRRRVTSDDRLWLAVAAHNTPFEGSFDSPGRIHVNYEFRVFGAMRRDRNRGSF